MGKLVTINHREKATTTSLIIAEGLGRQHKNILELIQKYEPHFSEIGTFTFETQKSGGRPTEYAVLNEEQTTFLFTLLRNSPTVVEFKKRLVKEFFRLRRELQRIEQERLSLDWHTAREEGKAQRNILTDTIASYVEYAEEQGCKGTARNAYTNFTRLINKACGIEADGRERATAEMLSRIAHFEGILAMKMAGLMTKGVHCKEIYHQSKETLLDIATSIPFLGAIYLPVHRGEAVA